MNGLMCCLHWADRQTVAKSIGLPLSAIKPHPSKQTNKQTHTSLANPKSLLLFLLSTVESSQFITR